MKLITYLQKEENMTREEANKALPILQAFAEGKVIQMLDDRSIWTDLTEREGLPIGILGESPNIFRIKSAPRYRPFKNKEEYWQEMLKHQPFAWIKEKHSNRYSLITEVNRLSIKEKEGCLFTDGFKYYTFADGTPFGIKTEE